MGVHVHKALCKTIGEYKFDYRAARADRGVLFSGPLADKGTYSSWVPDRWSWAFPINGL